MKPRQPSRASGERWQFHQAPNEWPGRCGAGHRLSRSLRRTTGRRITHMPADALKCKECSTTYPLDARYVCERCFGPLEVGYTRAEGRAPTSSSAGSRPARTRSGATPTSCPLEGAAAHARCPTGWTPLVKADRLAERLGLGELWIKNETANPTHSFKDRVVSVALARARSSASTRSPVPPPATSPTRSARTPPPPGCPAYVLIPADLEQEKILATAAYGSNVVGVQRQLRRGQPALHRDLRRPRRLGVREHQHAARTTPRAPRRSPSRPSSSSAGSCRTAWSRRSPPARCSPRSPRGFQELIDAGLRRGQVPAMNGAQALGCSPVAQAFAAGTDVCRPVKPDTIAKSLAIGNPADGPYAVELARAHRRRHRLGHRRRDPRGHPAAGRDDRHLHRDRRRRHHRGPGQARRARRHRPGRARRRLHHRRRAEDARRGPRGLRGHRDRAVARRVRRRVRAGRGGV